jgi:stage IV sporulation protein FB
MNEKSISSASKNPSILSSSQPKENFMIKRSYLLTHVMGIPVRVHITLIILLPFLAMQFAPWFGSGAFFFGLLCTAGAFASVALHELGHSWFAIRKGCRVIEIMLLPIGGVAKMTHIPSRPKAEFLIAIAGPATSALLALLCRLIGGFFMTVGIAPLAVLFFVLCAVNLMLCLLNLLPSFPMDGGRIFRAFMTPRLGRLKATALAARIGRIMAVAIGIFGLFSETPAFNKLVLIAIATFIYQAAGAEYRAIYMQQMSQEWFTVGQPADIEVSPPPYARKAPPAWKKWKKKTDAFFNDLFKNWD